MRKLRVLFIAVSLVGAFYLNGAVPQSHAYAAFSAGLKAQDDCYGYNYSDYGCEISGINCSSGSGTWCEQCDGYRHCLAW
jgi:hypothetical protein